MQIFGLDNIINWLVSTWRHLLLSLNYLINDRKYLLIFFANFLQAEGARLHTLGPALLDSLVPFLAVMLFPVHAAPRAP